MFWCTEKRARTHRQRQWRARRKNTRQKALNARIRINVYESSILVVVGVVRWNTTAVDIRFFVYLFRFLCSSFYARLSVRPPANSTISCHDHCYFRSGCSLRRRQPTTAGIRAQCARILHIGFGPPKTYQTFVCSQPAKIYPFQFPSTGANTLFIVSPRHSQNPFIFLVW